MDDPVLVAARSRYSVHETIDRLETALKAAGVAVLERIDQAAGAAAIGVALKPAEVLVFGNPRAATPPVPDDGPAAANLPFKVLAWEDAQGVAWVSYSDPAWLAASNPALAAAVAGAAPALAKFIETAVT